jgi:hypothetical protein
MTTIAHFPRLQIHRCRFRNTGKGVLFIFETSMLMGGTRLARTNVGKSVTTHQWHPGG